MNSTYRTGDHVVADGKNIPQWAVIDGQSGKVITLANTRKWAREFADPKKGERIAKVRNVEYQVAH